MAEWQDIPEIEVPGVSETQEGLSSAVQGIAGVVGTAIAVLDVLASFLVVKESPFIAALKILLSEIQEIITSISESAVHGLFFVPTSLDELSKNHMGGYGKFEQQFLNSLHDTEDPNRPQFGANQTAGAFILLLTRSNPSEFIQSWIRIYRFFDKNLNIKYPAPVNVRIRPAGELGLPEDQLLNMFTDEGRELDRLRFEWEEPRQSDDLFLDIFASNKFYLEKSKSREGLLELRAETPKTKKSPIHKRREQQSEGEQAREALLDEDGEFIYYWEPLNPDDPFIEIGDTFDISENRINFLAGSYAHIIEDVEPGSDNAFYYRVRSVPSDTELEEKEVLVRNSMGIQTKETVYGLVYEGEDITKWCPPSAPVFGNIPDIDTSFDLPTALLQLYRAAYLLRFDTEYRYDGKMAIGPNLISPAIRDSLYEDLDNASSLLVETSPDPQSGDVFEYDIFYWGQALLEEEDPNFYDQTVDAVRKSLSIDPNSFDPFGGVDEFIAPRFNLDQRERLRLEMDRAIDNKIKSLVPYLMNNEGLYQTFQDLYQNSQGDIDNLLRNGLEEQDLREETNIRTEIFSIVQLIEGGATQGTPPNWDSVQFTKDLFPIVEKSANKLMDFVNSLNNVLQSNLDELKDSINSTQNRLENLTALLDVIDELITVIGMFEEVSNLFNVLWIPPSSGGNAHIISEFRNAENQPDRLADEVTGAIVLAFGGPGPDDVSGIVNAIEFIFGG